MTSIFGYDFRYLWCAGKLAREGGNPYSVEPFRQCLHGIGWPAFEGVQALTHPPQSFWCYALLSYVPFQLSLWIWSIVSALILVICGRYWLVDSARSDVDAVVPLGLLTICFPPILSTLVWGQVNALHFMGLTGFAWLFRKNAGFASGLLISFTLTKPHLYIPVYGYVAAMLLRNRNWRVFVGGVVGLAFQLGASLVFFPRGVSLYYIRMGTLSTEASLPGATLAQQLVLLTHFTVWGPCFVIAGVILGAAIGWKDSTRLALLPVVACSGLILAPYNWSHGLVGTFPAFAPAIVRLRQRSSEDAFMLVIIALVCVSIPFVIRAQTQIVWMVLPFVASVVWYQIRDSS